VALLLNPLIPSSGVITPNNTKAAIIRRATKSTESTSVIKSIKAPKSRTIVIMVLKSIIVQIENKNTYLNELG